VRTYEELVGGVGQAVSFRARRQLARELLREHSAAIAIGGRSFPLYDMAMSGVSFFAGAEAPNWQVNDILEVEIRVHEATAYRGQARVAREERVYGQRRIGLQLQSGFLDLHEMQRLDVEQALTRDLLGGPERVFDRVPTDYREVLLQALHFAGTYQKKLAFHEAWLTETGRSEREERDNLVWRAIEAIRPRWQALCRSAGQVCAPLLRDRVTLLAAKACTEALLTPLMMASPLLHRAYHKPLGYPGDFTIMLHIYKDTFEGDTAFGRIFHKLACEDPLALGVRTRKKLLKELMTAEYTRRLADGQGMRALSLGCGSAREVVEFVDELPEPPRGAHWTLIDQEEKALSMAYHDVLRGIQTRGGGCAAQCLYLSFEQLIRDPLAIRGEAQDFVYCVGMFDYLPKRRAQSLVQALYERVAPGGLLAIANASGPNEHFWQCELVLDWSLIYRDQATLRGLADPVAASAASIEVRREESGAYDFLLVRKPS
jgi:extracellular factor (EF) 3-hydroxypalmitic acid methyl ester biosynthesis protein